jgi:hypothetical protein
MFATLSAGEAKRSLAVADLNIKDSDGGPCALHAALPPAPVAGENTTIPALRVLPATGTAPAYVPATPLILDQRPALVTTAVADAFSPFAVTAADGWNREGVRKNDVAPFGVTSLDTDIDRIEDRDDELWGGVTLGAAERDRALASIMAEWSGDGFAARLSSLEAAPTSVISALPEDFAARLSELEATLPADATPADGEALSASDWFFCRGAGRWELLNDENADALAEADPV